MHLCKEIRKFVPNPKSVEKIARSKRAKSSTINENNNSNNDKPPATVCNENSVAVEKVLKDINLMKRSDAEDAKGFYDEADGVKASEISISSTIMSAFTEKKCFGETFHAKWFHQIVDRVDAVADIIGAACINGVWRTVLIIEVGKSTKNSKALQVLAYGVNWSSTILQGQVMLLAELVFLEHEKFLRLTAMTLQHGLTHAVRVWEGCFDKNSCAAMLHACDEVAKFNHSPSTGANYFRITNNVWESNSRIYKVYDYRNRSIKQDQQRKTQPNIEHIKGVELEVGEDDFRIISYPKIDGTWFPTKVQHIISLVETVKLLHDKKCVHGDIRASNVVFGSDGSATLIDFDWAGLPNGAKYPSGFCLEINDGLRANDVQRDGALQFHHDWYAVSGIMGLCKTKVDIKEWKSLETFCRDNAVTDLEAKKRADKLVDYASVGIDFTCASSSTTGSPERPVEKKKNRAGEAKLTARSSAE